MIYYPMKLKSVSKNIIWGGDKLKKLYSKEAPFQKLAESWELTVRDDGMSVIENGEYSGISLGDFLQLFPSAAGTDIAGKFPLLIKFIDAADDLSVQVHPDDSYALANEIDGGKTEMWYVVNADEGAEIVYGTKDNVDESTLRSAIESGAYADVLRRIKVKEGDVYFIPSGQIHALCRGTLIAEIQQNSNITYRIYDYDRTDSEGKKRELHIKKALDTVRCYTDEDIGKRQFCKRRGRRSCYNGMKVIAECKYFRVSSLHLAKERPSTFAVDEKSFASLLFTDAEDTFITVGGIVSAVKSGDSYFIPAGSGEVIISGRCHALLSEV